MLASTELSTGELLCQRQLTACTVIAQVSGSCGIVQASAQTAKSAATLAGAASRKGDASFGSGEGV